MPVCVLCGSNLKTRGNLARHHRLLHEGKSVGHGHVPEKATLVFFVNRVSQTLSCPVHFCQFSRNRCKDVRSVAVHFSRCHPHHQLCVSYFCQRCNLYIDPSERHEHNRAHIAQDLQGGPFTPPVPVIDPQDHSLTYIDSPQTDSACLIAPGGQHEHSDAQTGPSDVGDDANISVLATTNGSFDSLPPSSPATVSPPISLAPISSPQPPATELASPPTLPSTAEILNGDAFLPSQPSPELLAAGPSSNEGSVGILELVPRRSFTC